MAAFDRPCATIDRRTWIGVALATFGLSGRARGEDAGGPAAVEARAREAKLGPFRSSSSKTFVALGDGPDAFRAKALELCEALAASYRDHFDSRGFGVQLPKEPLTIVTLANAKSYAAFVGEDRGPVIGGHYDLDANWLVMFDFRGDGRDRSDLPGNPEALNSLTLVHEAMHLLTYNTGLLDRRGNVPAAISEGLAIYAEPWRPTSNARNKLGSPNPSRLYALDLARKQGTPWIPVERLLLDDTIFLDKAQQQLAYVESWLLVQTHLGSTTRRARFRDYLDAIRPRRDPLARRDDAAAQLGDLDTLDRDLRKAARWPG